MSDYSRPLSLAELVTGRPATELERHLAEQAVLVSADPELPGALAAAGRLVATLARMPGRLLIDSDRLSGEQRDGLLAAVEAVRPSAVAVPETTPTVRVHFGLHAEPNSIRAIPDAFGAHIASDATVLLRQHRPGNALGVAVASAFAATEVFKVVASVPESRARRHPHLSFCPVTVSGDVTTAPDLPALPVDLALVGIGAVGSASASIIGELPLTGTALLVDRERFALENVATYSLGGEGTAAADAWKVELGAAAMRNLATSWTTEPVETIPGEIDAGRRRWPPVVLSGLDSIAARHATQRLWPDLLIDAATGETMVGIHVTEPDRPCMMCFFPPRHDGPSPAERVAAATGLPAARAARGDNPLTEEDLAELTTAQRAMLLPHLGSPVCGLADAFGLSSLQGAGYLPAIPFAAQQAACLGVGRVLAHLLGVERRANIVQYDVFRGPAFATAERYSHRPDCYCTERHTTIARVRALRREAMRAGQLEA
jgi:hypothetical protein